MHHDELTGTTPAAERGPGRASRLISRLYRSADPAARATILTALIRPLSPLALAAVASGAFAGFVARRRSSAIDVSLDEAGRFSSDQVLDLARFVEQVDLEAFGQAVSGIVASPQGCTAFAIELALLVLRQVRRDDAPRPLHGPTIGVS
jgi:hypothetical protein